MVIPLTKLSMNLIPMSDEIEKPNLDECIVSPSGHATSESDPEKRKGEAASTHPQATKPSSSLNQNKRDLFVDRLPISEPTVFPSTT